MLPNARPNSPSDFADVRSLARPILGAMTDITDVVFVSLLTFYVTALYSIY